MLQQRHSSIIHVFVIQLGIFLEKGEAKMIFTTSQRSQEQEIMNFTPRLGLDVLPFNSPQTIKLTATTVVLLKCFSAAVLLSQISQSCSLCLCGFSFSHCIGRMEAQAEKQRNGKIYRFRSSLRRSSCSPIRLTQDKVEF